MAIRGLVPITVLAMDRVAGLTPVLATERVLMAALTTVPILVLVPAAVRMVDPIPTTVLVKTAAILLAVPATATAPMQTAKAKMPAAMKTLRKPPISPQRVMRLPLGRLLHLR